MANPSFFNDDVALCERLQFHISRASQTFILTDSNVAEAIVPRIIGNLQDADRIEIIEVEPGEDSKSLEVAAQIWESLLECNADRKTLLINIGGGVITDLGGFVASTYKRGISFVHIPTSLMAMTDAAIGGKTGIDLSHFKNVVGTFAEATDILIQPNFIDSLPQNEIKSGMAEMIKHGIIADKTLFEALETIEDANPSHISLFIQRSADVKVKIVAEDFQESGLRKTLNFGHTIGHAIESVCLDKTPIAHGVAVGIGMQIESILANDLGLISSGELSRILQLLENYYPISFQLNWNELLVYLKNDKKNENDSILFALPNGIGSAQWNVKADENQIKKAAKSIINE